MFHSRTRKNDPTLALIPDELKSEEAAPLLYAGITTFSALRTAGRAGDTVAIQGIGGLGHLGVQFARRMGLRKVAIGGGPDKKHLAVNLGVHLSSHWQIPSNVWDREAVSAILDAVNQNGPIVRSRRSGSPEMRFYNFLSQNSLMFAGAQDEL